MEEECIFNRCPKCGSEKVDFNGSLTYRCNSCDSKFIAWEVEQ